MVVMELDCVRTYIWLPASVRWIGLDWIGEFIEIPRLAARQPSHYKVKSIVFISVIAFYTVVMVKCIYY